MVVARNQQCRQDDKDSGRLVLEVRVDEGIVRVDEGEGMEGLVGEGAGYDKGGVIQPNES